MQHQRPRSVATLLLAATIACAVALTALAAQTADPATATAAQAEPGVNGYRTIGYFPGWVPPSGGYQVADLERTGAVDDLTHLNYAFGNVTSDLICDLSDTVGPEGLEGDPHADYLRLVPAHESVDGQADDADQPLAGNLNQLRKLKERHPDLMMLVSLGGWTWSDHFSDAVATPQSRQRLVDSCVDLWIRGNLPVRGAQGGDGVAAGIFDGIDIDWEWPGADGEHPSPRPADDAANFLAFMELLRASLDEVSAQTGREYLLSGFAPAGSVPRTRGGWTDPRLAAVVDYLNVQGYDYHGAWAPHRTGHHGNLHPYSWPDSAGGGDANGGLAVDRVLAEYRAAGYRGDQLNLGLAAYAHGWGGVTDPTPGADAAESIGTPTYAQLHDVGTEYYDAVAGAAYRWDGDRWYSLDTPRSVTAKATWVAAHGYSGGFIWAVTGDHDNEIAGALAGALRAAGPGPLAVRSGAVWWGGAEEAWWVTSPWVRGERAVQGWG